jgi:MFS family permease
MATETLQHEAVPVPGTVYQIDLDGTFSELRHNKSKNLKDVILIPQPSNHPDDPLNWSYTRKMLGLFSLFLFCFLVGPAGSALSPAFLLISKDVGISVAELNTGIGIQYIFLGWSNLILQPMALNYGRRPVLLLSAVGTAMTTLWTAYVRSRTEFWLNRLFVGVFLAPVESLIEICIADLSFTHQRGKYMALYTWSLFNSGFLSPIAAGFIADRFGWRWIPYTVAITASAATVILFFILEETMFYRPQIQEEFIDARNVAAIAADTKDTAPTSASSPADEKEGERVATLGLSESHSEGQVIPSQKTYAQKLKIWGLRDPRQPAHFLRSMTVPFLLMRFPVIVFGGLLVGSVLAWFNVVTGTIATILGNPPYNFSTDMVGVSFVAAAIGVTVGCYFSGPLSDWLIIYMARRNGGVREPEHRLWVAMVPLLIHPAGFILYGVGAAHDVHWVAILFGLGFVCACLPMGSAVAFNYILDSYKEVGGDALVTCILFRNTMGMCLMHAAFYDFDANIYGSK